MTEGRASEATIHPLEPALGQESLSARLYPAPAKARPRVKRPVVDKPTHYKVICISMYTDDLVRLDAMVDDLKHRGLTKANRSALIRYALGRVDLSEVPKAL